MKELMFLNPVMETSPHPTGMQLTVRRGNKWAGQCLIGERVALVETSTKKTFGFATIESMVVMPFTRLQWQETVTLTLEHDAACRKYDGLLKAMELAYPGFDVNETVTLVFFIPEAAPATE